MDSIVYFCPTGVVILYFGGSLWCMHAITCWHELANEAWKPLASPVPATQTQAEMQVAQTYVYV